jgi:hypothetical protein
MTLSPARNFRQIRWLGESRTDEVIVPHLLYLVYLEVLVLAAETFGRDGEAHKSD